MDECGRNHDCVHGHVRGCVHDYDYGRDRGCVHGCVRGYVHDYDYVHDRDHGRGHGHVRGHGDASASPLTLLHRLLLLLHVFR